MTDTHWADEYLSLLLQQEQAGQDGSTRKHYHHCDLAAFGEEIIDQFPIRCLGEDDLSAFWSKE